MNSYELEEQYREFLDEVYGTVEIAGIEYDVSRVLEAVDPVAFRCGMNDYEDSLGEEDEDGS